MIYKRMILTAILLLMVAVLAFTQHSEEGFQFTRTEDASSVIITGYTGSSTTVNIPAQIRNLPVTQIGRGAFRDLKLITIVTIPDSVTSIGREAFRGCSSLTSVTIGNGVTTIGNGAFMYCNSLTSITIPSRVTAIEHAAFMGCAKLTNITVDENNQNFSSMDEILYNKRKTHLLAVPIGIKGSFTIPNSVTHIGSGAFTFSSLTSITLPNNLTTIDYEAFAGCRNLKSITIPNGVTTIGNQAFVDSGLTSVIIPDTVTSIGVSAFEECTGLTSATIGNGVTSIAQATFKGCTNLESVVLGNKVSSINDGAFNGCSRLAKITSHNPVPPSINERRESVFGNTPIVGARLRDEQRGGWIIITPKIEVPFANVNAYKTAPYWKSYANFISDIW